MGKRGKRGIRKGKTEPSESSGRSRERASEREARRRRRRRRKKGGGEGIGGRAPICRRRNTELGRAARVRWHSLASRCAVRSRRTCSSSSSPPFPFPFSVQETLCQKERKRERETVSNFSRASIILPSSLRTLPASWRILHATHVRAEDRARSRHAPTIFSSSCEFRKKNKQAKRG